APLPPTAPVQWAAPSQDDAPLLSQHSPRAAMGRGRGSSPHLEEGEQESLDGALDHIDTAMDFWLSQFEGPAL
ncbi:MAG: hypothetical protein AAFY43_10770, partial [Pseudomonadota bacterium]